jgi:hypothetical protein
VEKTIYVFRHFRWIRLVLLCAITATLGIQSSARPPRPTPPPPVAAPPQPLRISIKVKRDEPVEIPLGIYGNRYQTLEFKIRVRPAAGQLSEPKQVGQESAVVTYTAPADLAISKDQFTYSVRSREGVSAPSVVQIAIIDEPPVLAGPALVEFGRMMAGEKSVQTIEIANTGGGLAEGTLEASAPWQIEGQSAYRLRAGEKQSVVLSLNTSKSGRLAGELRCTPSASETKAGRVIELKADVLSQVSVLTEQLTLGNGADSAPRSGSIEVVNNTQSPQTLSISAGPRLSLPKSLTLQPQATSRIAVELQANDFGAIEDEILIQSSAETFRLPVRAGATPALLQVDRKEIRFTPVQAGNSAQEKLTLENQGGHPAAVSVVLDEPFSAGFTSAVLQPGERRELPLLFRSSAEGSFSGHLKITAPPREIILPLSAQTMSASTTSRAARPAKDAPPQTRPLQSDRTSEPAHGAAETAPREPVPQMPHAPEIITLTPSSVDLGWNHRGSISPTYKSEMREIALHNDELEMSWSPLPHCQLELRGGRVEVKITGLTPATVYSLRFTPLDPEGKPADRPRTIQFITPHSPKAAAWITLPKTLALLLCLCLIGIARQKWFKTP